MSDREFSEWAADQLAAIDDDTTDHAEPLGPTSVEDAERLGYELAMADEDPVPPAGWGESQFMAFIRGLHAGWEELSRDRAEHAAYLDSLQQPGPEMHHAEMVEGASYSGHPAYEG